MCAAVIGSTPLTVIVQHTSSRPGLIRRVAVPMPSGSPWFGTPWALTSAAPVSVVVKGRPPSAAAGDAPANVRLANIKVEAPIRRAADHIAASSVVLSRAREHPEHRASPPRPPSNVPVGSAIGPEPNDQPIGPSRTPGQPATKPVTLGVTGLAWS